MKKAISWRRVSTFRQGRSGLGLEAQKELIDGHIQMQGYEWVADYCETYTGTHLSGCAELRKAIEHCKRIGAILIVSKCDRFRNAAEALTIYEELNGNIYFCDAPTQDKMILTIMFAIYEREALNISIRTKAALQAKKKRDGSWANEYGKNTGTTRAEAWDKCLDSIIATNKRKAQDNENNVRFSKWLNVWESKNGIVDRHTDLIPMLEEANALGLKTSSGMDFNKQSLRQMIYRTHARNLQKKCG